jgi:histone-lysine N-methyltransferase SETMAR
VQLDQFSETAVDFTEDAEVDEIDAAILSALEVQPFGSVRDIELTYLARSTVHWHLTRSLGYLVRHLRWIRHVLTEEQNRIQDSNSQPLLAILQEQQDSSWQDLVTLDEFWFYLHTDHERIWLALGDTPPDGERYMIQSWKFMLTIVWGDWVSCCQAPAEGGSVSASFYTTEILSEVVLWRNDEPGTAGQKLTVHSDNARAHTAKQTRDFIEGSGIEQTPHPPYSPILAPSDFYLFNYLKDRLQGQHFEDGDQLFDAIMALTGTIEKVILQRVFLEWMERLRRCTDTNDE